MADRVLFVCHANLCRSPMAEYLAAQAAGGPAGRGGQRRHRRAWTADPMHPYAAAVAAENGARPGGIPSRALTAGRGLVDAALVLTATRRQRAVCVTLAPGALRRTFTLRQFGRLAAGRPTLRTHQTRPTRPTAGGGRAAAAQARGRSSRRRRPRTTSVDPIGGTPEDFRRCAEEIERSLTRSPRSSRQPGEFLRLVGDSGRPSAVTLGASGRPGRPGPIGRRWRSTR